MQPVQGKVHIPMHDNDLLRQALSLDSPWSLSKCILEEERHQLDIFIDFRPGATFPCPRCRRPACKAHDAHVKTWRHLPFLQYETLLHARVPRIDCRSCGILNITLPWARPGSSFTLLLEALLLVLVQQMPILTVARILNLHDTRIGRITRPYSDKGRVALERFRAFHGREESTSTEGSRPLRKVNCDPGPQDLARLLGPMPSRAVRLDRFEVARLAGETMDLLRREDALEC